MTTLYTKPFYFKYSFSWTQEYSCIPEAINTRILDVFTIIKYREFYSRRTTTTTVRTQSQFFRPLNNMIVFLQVIRNLISSLCSVNVTEFVRICGFVYSETKYQIRA